MLSPDPMILAQSQIARDREATRDFPALFARKVKRMADSPLAYLRGTAPLYYALLAEHPELANGPSGEGWLVGDAHLENFGAFRTADADGTESVVFDVNDFDEAIIGPFRFDVVRLLTSIILAGRELGSNGTQSVALCSAILDGYVGALFSSKAPGTAPPPIRRLLDKVGQRTHKDLLDQRTERAAGVRRFVRGDHYQDLATELVPKAHAAFQRYVERLDPHRTLARDHFDIEDVAFRIAGCGSLGSLRVAVLTQGKGEVDSRWIFDMKAEGAPSARALLGEPGEQPAERVLAATQKCLARPPRMMGTTSSDELSLFVRRLLPQEDKLDLLHMRAEELSELARHLGALLANAHARGATSVPDTSWTTGELGDLTDHAIVIAGLHESAYLAMCRSLCL